MLRGNFVRSSLLCDAPPPPPPNADVRPPEPDPTSTLRERFAVLAFVTSDAFQLRAEAQP